MEIFSLTPYFSEIKTKYCMLVDAGYGYDIEPWQLEGLELVAFFCDPEIYEVYKRENFFVVVGNGLFAVDIFIDVDIY